MSARSGSPTRSVAAATSQGPCDAEIVARVLAGDQATYIRAYYHLDQFRGPSGIQSWLARIAINEANGRRRKAPALVHDDEGFAQLRALETSEPERMLIDSQTRCLVQKAIERLPEDFRVVFMLRGVEQLTVAETAAVLDIKQATVKTRFHRARALLRASLGRHAGDAVQEAFRFDGSRCDEIVAAVLLSIRARQ